MQEPRFEHPYAAFLDKVEKPSRYVGGEFQEAVEPPTGVKARVCLAFPDTYEIGMSHLGTKILYSVLNKTPGIFCERAFAPWGDMEAELRRRALPVLTLETARPLSHFDVLGFSLQYELTYTNVLNLLDLAGLPLRAADRGDEAPLVIAGGPTATHPEPLAPFIDAFFIGEAEEHLPRLCLAAAQWRRDGVGRRERLIRLAESFPLYVPELYATEVDEETGFVVVGPPLDPRVPVRPKRVWLADINKFPFPSDSPLPHAEAIFDRMAIEIARGCTEGCRFCQAGMIYRPVRERDPVAIVDALVQGVRKGGYDETSLTGLSTADYSCVTPLVKAAMAKMRDEKVSLSVSSLRAYGLNEDLLADMATMKAQGLTFAPEAGTQRMRDVITKNVTETDITESAHRVFSRGFQRMKLYFMIGLPTETDEDVRGIVETAARMKDIGKRYNRTAEVRASVSTHVPKPHTPFQWCAMDTEADTERKQALLAQTARELRVDLKMHENHQSHLEGIFSRGDRACASLLERAFRLGCRFDGWDDVLRLDLWDRAIEEEQDQNNFFPGRYLGTIPVTARLPWDHLDMALGPDFLLKEYKKALKDRLSPPCGKPFKQLLHPNNVAAAREGAAQKLVCYDCGVACDLSQMKEERLFFLRRMNAWTPPPPPPPVVRRDAGPREHIPGEKNRSTVPVTRIVQGDFHRYRLRYTKLGRVTFLGHLDLIRHLPRVFRRAGLGVHYSIGFHPKAELSFGPALGLGVPSLGEILDVKLDDAPDPADLLRALNGVSLRGIQFLDAVKLDSQDRAQGRVVARTDFAALLPDGVDLDTGLLAFNSGGPLMVRRANLKEGEGKGPKLDRMVDVRRSLLAVSRPDVATNGLLNDALGWSIDRVVSFGLTCTNEGSARPLEVVEALWGTDVAVQSEFARTGLRARTDAGVFVDPLDLGPLRVRSAVAVMTEIQGAEAETQASSSA